MTIILVCDTVETDASCATSGNAIAAGATIASLTMSDRGDGSRRATATTTLTHHDPHALLESLTVVLGKDVPASAGTSAAIGAKHPTRATRRTQHAGADPLKCALTGRAINPEDAVILLPCPSNTPAAACGLLPLVLPEAAELLAPVLRTAAVGAGTGGPSLCGLENLPEPQRARARAALEAAVSAAAVGANGEATGDGGQEPVAAASGGWVTAAPADGATAAAVAAAVDTSSVLLDVAPQEQRTQGRVAEGSPEKQREGVQGQGKGSDPDQPRAKRQRVGNGEHRPPAASDAAAYGSGAEGPAAADDSNPDAASPPAAAAAAAAKPPRPARRGRRGLGGDRAGDSLDGPGAVQGGDRAARTRKEDNSRIKGDDGNGDGGGPEVDVRAGHGGVGSGPDLERERAELMERNRRKLLELQLPGLVSGLAAAVAAEAGHGGGSGGATNRRQASQRGVGAKRSREASAEAPPPRRVSLRQRGVAADSALAAGIEHETATGVKLAAGRQAVEAATGRTAGQPTPEKLRHPKGELPFRSENGDERSDAAFLEAIKRAAGAGLAAGGGEGEPQSPGTAAGWRGCRPQRAGGGAERLGGETLARLGLQEKDVAKMTKDGVTHMAWLPGSERLMLAAADKSGKVSLWDVDPEDGGGGPAASTDGVLMFAPHSEYVSGMRWLGRQASVGPCRLITAAYDGSLRALDLGGAGTWLELPAPGDPQDSEFSALEVTSDGRTAYLGDPLGNFDVVDLRAPPARTTAANTATMTGATAMTGHQTRGQSSGVDNGTCGVAAEVEGDEAAMTAPVGPRGGLQICDRKINSLHLEPSGGHLLATSCSDGTVCIWDVRKLESAAAAAAGRGQEHGHAGHKAHVLIALRHSKSCHAAYWADDGSKRLLSTSYDDTIRVWSDPAAAGESRGHFKQALCIPHNNQTGRWITPFRAVWNAACDAVLVGNMRRGLDVFGIGQGVAVAEDAVLSERHGKGGSAAAKASPAEGKLLRTLTSDYMTAIPSRAVCHPTLPVVVAATSSGRCHVWR